MKEICKDGLYIGNREDAFNCLTEDTDIRHILTIEAEPLSGTDIEYDKGSTGHDILLKHVRCLDQIEADLLSFLDECIQFIVKSLRNGKVLVHWFLNEINHLHCRGSKEEKLRELNQLFGVVGMGISSAGVSRSATVILAYMMYSQNISLKQALHDLKAVYPKADPNPGFMFQLHLFEAMGKKVDKSNSLYKQYHLQNIAKQAQRTGYRELPEEILKDSFENQETGAKRKNYKCRKCRHKLFNSENRLDHIPGAGEDFLSWNDKLITEEHKKLNTSKCTSYFIEPLPWMASLLVGTVEGKLCCPKCSGRIGSFNWAGEQCSCGRWVTPAFQFHKSRIDES